MITVETMFYTIFVVFSIEMYKVYNKISPDFVCENFPQSKVTYGMRKRKDFLRPRVNTVLWVSETLN